MTFLFFRFSVFYLKLGRVYAFIESVKRRELLKLCKISFLFKALDHIADNITLCFDAFVGQDLFVGFICRTIKSLSLSQDTSIP